MTMPTQAQIDAAAKAIRAVLHKDHRGAKGAEALAEAALTAATGVPEQEHIPQNPGQKPSLLPSGDTAAEAGDELESGVLLTQAIDEVIAEDVEKERLQELVSQGIQIERQLRKELLTLRAATIERCAQVAEHALSFDDDLQKSAGCLPVGQRIAAAIRALKDKP